MTLSLLLALALAAADPATPAAAAPADAAPAEAADSARAAVAIEAAADTAAATVAGFDMQFICGDGNLLGLSRDRAAGVLRGTRAGDGFTLHQQVIRGGVERFVNGPDSIVLAGDTAWLTRGREVRVSCARVPAAPTPGILWGTIDTGSIAVPPGSRLKVLLVDAARADAPAVEIASTTLQTTDTHGPFWYLLRYDAARADAPAQAALEARLQPAKSPTLHVSEAPTPIPADGRPAASPIRLSVGHAARK